MAHGRAVSEAMQEHEYEPAGFHPSEGIPRFR
jgi:hypothetical protein